MRFLFFIFIFINVSTSSQFNSNFNTLIWDDEFTGIGMIDTFKWHHQTLLPNGNSWWNGEQQHYTNSITNSYQNNGLLTIVARKEIFTDQGVTKNYTSARLNSKFAFTYGRVEVRAKLPSGDGTWPAIWTLGKNITENGGYWYSSHGTTNWPACGEIDIMEHWGHNANYIQSALHNTFSSGNTINHGGTMANNVTNDFHLYAMEWTENEIKFSLDSVVFYEYNPQPKNIANWPFNDDQYLLINIAMGSTWFTIDPFFSSSKMEVDFVRVYQEAPTEIHTTNNQKDFKIYPNPFTKEINFELTVSQPFKKAILYSSMGQEIKCFLNEIELENYPWEYLKSGNYFIRLVTLKKSDTYKIVKF